MLSARARKLHLENCALASFTATGATFEGFLLITQSRVLQGVSLIEARVGQSVGLSGSEIFGCDGPALHADGLKVDGGFVLGTFPNENECAVGGEVFRATGEVRMLGACIGRDLDCSGGRFDNTGGVALAADRADIRGEVRLASGFHATGEVRLWRTRIGSDLTCLGGKFDNSHNCRTPDDGDDPRAPGTGGPFGEPGDYALRADGAEVKGSVNLCQGFRSKGVVYLVGTQIDSDLNCSGGKFDNSGGDALAADSAKIGGGARLDAGFHANGLVGLLGARIGGQLNCSGGWFNNPGRRALGADGVEIRGSVNLGAGFQSDGEVRFLSASIGDQFNCTGGHFSNLGGTALLLQETKVRNSILLRGPDLQIAGDVHLFGAKVSTLADDPTALVGQCVTLHLDGFVYERFAPIPSQDVNARLQWLDRQPDGYHPQPFDQLANVFRRSGDDYEAKAVLIAKRRKRRTTLSGWPSKYWDYLQDCTVLYGWQPWRALVIGLVVMLTVFVLIAASQAMGLVIGPSGTLSSYHPFVHALDVFLPVIDLGLESRWSINTASGGWFAWLVRVSLWALPVVGWVTVTLALAALTGLVKRE